jgi:hypothetical protein
MVTFVCLRKKEKKKKEKRKRLWWWREGQMYVWDKDFDLKNKI